MANPLKVHKSILKSIHSHRRFSRTLRVLGPGLVTGAADDDPSGIATYSQAGAMYGYKLLWMIPFMYPLLLSVQGACSKIGAVTGKGLAELIKENYSKKMLYLALLLVVIANIVNIGADFGAMAATLQLIVPVVPFTVAVIGFALLMLGLELFVPYKKYAKILKWLAIVLFAYPITAFVIGQPWGQILAATLNPTNIHFDFPTIMIMVGLIGTTISPYLFFWDTSEIVEDEITHRRLGLKKLHLPKITRHFLRNVWIDNVVGMTLAAITAWFIMIVCATVLNSHGVTEITTAADAAKALEPLVQGFPNAGLIAKLIFSVGILGTGLLAIPVLAGSCSYAITEAFGWKEGLSRKVKKAKGFYIVIIIATIIGLLINFVGIDPIQALVWAAVVNGLAAVPLLVMIARIGRNKRIMGEHTVGVLGRTGIWVAFAVMAIAAGAMLISMLIPA
jgi:NRAMP (natural resistance-associated macrophage protein)-like metal ion transporter